MSAARHWRRQVHHTRAEQNLVPWGLTDQGKVKTNVRSCCAAWGLMHLAKAWWPRCRGMSLMPIAFANDRTRNAFPGGFPAWCCTQLKLHRRTGRKRCGTHPASVRPQKSGPSLCVSGHRVSLAGSWQVFNVWAVERSRMQDASPLTERPAKIIQRTNHSLPNEHK